MLLLTAVGCTSGPSPEEVAASESAAAALAALTDVADLGILADEVAARDAGASEFVPAQDGTSLDVGDAVQTDDAGRAQLTYGDGSLTRIDKDSVFEVVALTLEPLKAQLKLDAGRVWNRVQDLTETQGSFEVETPVATAAVRGTAFTVACVRDDDACTFSVAEGLVEVTTISDIQVDVAAGESVTVLADGSIEGVVALTDDDDWTAENLDADGDEGFDDVTLPQEPEEGGTLAAASIGGRWNVTHTVTRAKPNVDGVLNGFNYKLIWQIEQPCDAPCNATSPRTGPRGGKLAKNPQSKLTNRGGIYAYNTTFSMSCVEQGTNKVLVPLSYEGPLDGRFWVSEATVNADGEVQATRLEGARSGFMDMTPEAKSHPTCGDKPKHTDVEWTSVFTRAG